MFRPCWEVLCEGFWRGMILVVESCAHSLLYPVMELYSDNGYISHNNSYMFSTHGGPFLNSSTGSRGQRGLRRGQTGLYR
jgi:hypothetical protein